MMELLIDMLQWLQLIGYHCCLSDSTCQPEETPCYCASQGDCRITEECCNSQCQDETHECIGCGPTNLCPEG